MKVLSLNLQGFEHWDKRQDAIRSYLEQQSADLVLFQEVVYLPSINPMTQATLLNQQLNYKYEQIAVSRLQRGVEIEVYREGLAALSRFVVTKHEVLVLRQHPKDHLQRIVQLLDIETSEGIYKIAHVHFSFPQALAEIHLAELLAILEARHEVRFIVGDFNMSQLESTEQQWQPMYHTTAEQYISYPSKTQAIDRVLAPSTVPIRDFAVSSDGLSDHRAISFVI